MTVSYSKLVANGSNFGCFWRILYKWRGSVYKLVWRELLVFLCLYFLINLLYRYVLERSQQETFERIRAYFSSHSESIPMSFVLGFYVTLVVRRWWEQYRLLPWPDTLALFVSAAIPGADERGRLMRRNIVRYAVLAYVITLQHVSVRVKKRFPSWQHMVDAGLMMESEKKIFELMDGKTTIAKYWMPLVWATNIINRARKESLIQSDHVVQTMLQELSDIRRRLGSLIGYDTVCVPLVYTQVVTLSVYTYFIGQLMTSQFVITRDSLSGSPLNISSSTPLPSSKDQPDVFFPFFTTLQFCFYIGWLKVAEVLINPFGEDDDDIELNWLIDRHIKNPSEDVDTECCLLSKAFSGCLPREPKTTESVVPPKPKPWPFAAYMIVDEMHEEHPELLKDQYWEEVVPKDLPYTVASECYRRTEPKGSAQDYKVKESDALYANLMPSRKLTSDDVYADYESVDTPLVERRSKNWFQRQLQRMGSVRSSSTTYSSAGGLFGRTRHNSVYSAPENGLIPGQTAVSNAVASIATVPATTLAGVPISGALTTTTSVPQLSSGPQKMSLYDRIVNRRSSRGQNKRPVAVKNRPRIPTPDVSREVAERVASAGNVGNLVGYSGGTAAQLQLQHAGHGYTIDTPVVQIRIEIVKPAPLDPDPALFDTSNTRCRRSRPNLYSTIPSNRRPDFSSVLLTPIQEAETVSPAGTKALAQAVLSPALTSAGLGSMRLTATQSTLASSSSGVGVMAATPVSVALAPITFASTGSRTNNATVAAVAPSIPATVNSPTVSEINAGSEDDSGAGSSNGSVNLDVDRERKTSNPSQKRGEVYV